MIPDTFLLSVIILLGLINLGVIWFRKPNVDLQSDFNEINQALHTLAGAIERSERLMREEFKANRSEAGDAAKANREELAATLEKFGAAFKQNVNELNAGLAQKFEQLIQRQSELNQGAEKQLTAMRTENTKQLEEMRRTVDEKLQKTLHERLTLSFETVRKELQTVQEGIGEMKNLANDVGGLKRVLSNVKMRGGIGEVQLEMLLEQILAPDQYAANVKTKSAGGEIVEFAVKFPGKHNGEKPVWLPIDAKFPKDHYERLQDAYEEADPEVLTQARKQFEAAVKKMAKDIADKYLEPPNTTDFGLMFLPFEGIYAEVVRNAALLEELQRDYKILAVGPTTLAAILNSLQIGFKTLAIEQRSSEVWQVLGAVKKEFENFGGLMSKAKKNIQVGLDQLDDVMGVRTRAITRKLKSVESLSSSQLAKPVGQFSAAPDESDDGND